MSTVIPNTKDEEKFVDECAKLALLEYMRDPEYDYVPAVLAEMAYLIGISMLKQKRIVNGTQLNN